MRAEHPRRATLGLLIAGVLLAACASPLDRDGDSTERWATPSPTATEPPLMRIVTPTPFVPGQLVTPDPNATVAPQANPGTYVVAEGDTLYAIALRFNVELEAIIAANGLSDPNDIQVGQELIIPPRQ